MTSINQNFALVPFTPTAGATGFPFSILAQASCAHTVQSIVQELDEALNRLSPVKKGELMAEPNYGLLPDPGILDVEQARNSTGGKVKTLEHITCVFLENTPARIEELQAALIVDNWEEVTRLAHCLKGAAFALGGKNLGGTAAALEQACRNNTPEDRAGLMVRIRTAFTRFEHTLQHINWSTLMAEF